MTCGRVRGTGATGPRGELALHLAAEFVTAALLIAAGAAWLAAGPAANAVMAAGLGMLLYTVIASPGYFLARRDLPVVAMFGVLAALTVTALAVVLA
jgi:hypothetical protein